MIIDTFYNRIYTKLLCVFAILTVFSSAISSPINVIGQTDNEVTQDAEICDNGIDDDADGLIDVEDEDCPTPSEEQQQQQSSEKEQQQSSEKEQQQSSEKEQQQSGKEDLAEEFCDNGVDDDNDGSVDENCPVSTLSEQKQPKAEELCGNDIDDDLDGQVDEDCTVTEVQEPPVEQVPPESNLTPTLSVEKVPPIVNLCQDNLTECTPNKPKAIPPIVNQCPDNDTSCTLSNEPKLIPPVTEPCVNNESTCINGEPKLIPPVTEPCLDNGSECMPAEPIKCPNNLTECTSQIEPSDCFNNMTTTDCLPQDGLPLNNFVKNTRPIADAGADQFVQANSTVVLDATRSSDPDGNLTSYIWQQLEGTPVTLNEADSATARFFAPSENSSSELKFEVSIMDNQGAQDSDYVSVFVNRSTIVQEPIQNIQVKLNQVPESIPYNETYSFTGSVNGISKPQGRNVEIKAEDASEKGSTLAFDDLDRNGNFVAQWYPGDVQSNYTVFAAYEDQFGNIVKSSPYHVNIILPSLASNLTLILREDQPYIKIWNSDWNQKALNVYVIAKDDYSKKFIPDAVAAIHDLSSFLREYTHNFNSWQLNVFSTSNYPDIIHQIISPINIQVELKHEGNDCDPQATGWYHDANPIQKIFNHRGNIEVFTGCMNQDIKKSVNIYRTTIHEMIHGLGIGHAYHELGDLMCGLDRISREEVYTCKNAKDNYKDNSEPTEFDFRAILYKYGSNGFVPPNRNIVQNINDRYTCEPLPCEPATNPFIIKGKQKVNGNEGNNPKPNEFSDKKDISGKGTKFDTTVKKSTKTDTTDSVSSFQPYRYKQLGISLEHPPDWVFASLKNGIQLIKEKNGVYVEIRKHTLESSNANLKQYVLDDMKQRSIKRQNFEPLNITETKISANLPAYKTEYSFLKTEDQKDFTSNGTTNKILRYWTFANGNAYTVAYVSESGDYDLYLPVAMKIIDTLKINPVSQQSFSNNDSNDNQKSNDSNDRANGGDKVCSDFDKKNFKVQPGDPYHLDADKDGIACEG